jgi:histone H3/H4
MREIPKAVAKRIVRNAGGKDARVSDGAAVKMAEYMEEMGTKLSESAIEMAEHAGRKTVKESDIMWAAEHI